MIIPRLYKVCQSISAYIAGNPRDAKSCHLVTHVNLITSNEVTEDIFDRVIHSCVDLNPDSFYDVILIRKLEIKMKLMTKIPNNLTPKSMSLILIIIALKKTSMEVSGYSCTSNCLLYLYQLALYMEL